LVPSPGLPRQCSRLEGAKRLNNDRAPAAAAVGQVKGEVVTLSVIPCNGRIARACGRTPVLGADGIEINAEVEGHLHGLADEAFGAEM
jgi:hypothetical protein